ncbi:hypothetical protein B566_EDAN015810 [Ephemera danica]|nr:hypothetical protein B566_EDAN015810 [Ephemera danica]
MDFRKIAFICDKCSWPELDPSKADVSIDVKSSEPPVYVMLLADTHLLGTRRGHWFDKLRREWQMYRAFQTSMSLHSPDLVFILGDVFDEGLWSSDQEFNSYVARFHSLFEVPHGTGRHVVVGNHDIGFHYGISPYLQERFASAMDAPSVQMLSVRGVHFVLVNSMAMEDRLKCSKGITKCKKVQKLAQYSKPILLQLLDWLQPRVIATGHTHHGCHKIHRQDAHEWTVPSFSWRNKNNPSFLLTVFAPNNYAVKKCFMPTESTVIYIYLFGMIILIGLLTTCSHKRWRHFKRS